MFSSSGCCIFHNPEALAKLAALYPEVQPCKDSGEGPGRTDGKRTTASSGAKIKDAQVLGSPWPMKPDPAWIQERLALIESIKARNAAEMDKVPKPAITVTLPDGKEISGSSKITPAGMKESHVHDVTITKETPNYRMSN